LSVPVQSIAWKDSSLTYVNYVFSGTLSPTHSVILAAKVGPVLLGLGLGLCVCVCVFLKVRPICSSKG